LLHHENARLHTSSKIQDAFTKCCYTVLTHLLCSPDLAPSDFDLFGALKDAFHGMECEIGGDVFAQYMSRTRQGTDKAYAHLFLLGTRA
jgi:hypothetical protein